MSASRVSYQIIGWSAVVWIVICVAPYVYALNDLTTWALKQYIRFRSGFGSKADIGSPPIDVRFTPKSGHTCIAFEHCVSNAIKKP
jgi:hypothetical protein